MKIIMFKALLILLILFGTYGPVPDSFAIDPPHDVTNDISCTSLCHLTASPAPAWRSQPTGTPTIDYTYANNLCKACHIPTYPMSPQAQDVQTHSSAQTTTTYGTWVIECRTCHDPHYQKQVAAYPISTLNSIVTGTVLTVASNRYSLTVSTALTSSAYIDYVLVPNTAYPTRLYRITDNSATTIMVSPKDPFDTSLVQPNAPFVIRYPGLVKDQISTPNSGTRTVRFFNNQGPRSFATSTTTIDGICQVCHTKTKYFTNDGTKFDQGHPASGGVNCTNCHTHQMGFKGSCNSCHGNPPINGTIGGPSGLAFNELGTGATTPGAHGKHAVSLGYVCDTCHSGGMPASAVYDKKIQMGFNMFGTYQNGNYDGRTSPAHGYTYAAGNGGTTITQNGTKTCGTIYCHSNGKAGTVAASYASPAWDGAPLSCTSCHGNPPAYANGGPGAAAANSHPKHVTSSNITCTKCHNQTTLDNLSIRPDVSPSKHVDGNPKDVYFDSATIPTGAYAPATKTCSSITCHGTGTPQWGGASLACNACHNANSTLQGKHAAHYGTTTVAVNRTAASVSTQAATIYSCGVCHDPSQTVHAGGMASSPNQAAEVQFDTTIAGNGNYLTNGVLAGTDNGFNYTSGTCVSTYCHSNGLGGTPNNTAFTWGAASTLDCKGCHSYTAASGSPLSSGKHTKHVTSYLYGCNQCHNATTSNGITITDHSKHVNHVKDVAWGAMNSGGNAYASPQCSNIYCHSQGTSPNAPYPAPSTAASWTGSLPVDCTGCHRGDGTSAGPMTSGTHAQHTNNATITGVNYTCVQCHSTTVAGGANRVISSPSHSHVNKAVDVRFTSFNPAGVYSTDGHAPNGTASFGSCSSLYCHSNGKIGTSVASFVPATWGGASIGCNGCHGTSNANGAPDYTSGGSGAVAANSHSKHAISSNIGCPACHYQTTTTGTSIRADVSPSKHINAIVQDISFDPATNPSGTYAPAGKTCSTTYCHGSGTNIVWGGSTICSSCHEASSALSTSSPANNRHSLHYSTTAVAAGNTTGRTTDPNNYLFNCGTCHDPAGTQHAGGMADAVRGIAAQISFNISWATPSTGTYTAGTTIQQDNKGYGYSANNRCSNLYCHSNGAPLGGPATYQTVTWNQAAISPNCGICHASSPTTNKHAMHISTYSYGCAVCHSTTVSSNTTIANKDLHVNGIKDVAWDSMNTNGGAYSSPTCSNTYCHSQGTGANAPYPDPNTTASWSGSLPANCVGCHGSDSSSGNALATASHGRHVVSASMNCAQCHATTTTAARTVTNRANHVNRLVNIAFDAFSNPSGTASYNGSTSPLTKAPGSAYGSCVSVYCHGSTMSVAGDRNGGTTVTPTWGNAATGACGSCHGASLDSPPLRGSHVMHAGSNALGNGGRQIACTVCHYSYTANHVNGSTNWTFNAAEYPWLATARYRGALSGSTSPVPSTTYGQCTNLYCHSIVQTATGQALTGLQGEYKTPQWGNSATGQCGSCHLADDGHIGQKINTGSHTRHLDYPFTTTLESTRCAICHKLNAAGTVNDCNACHTNEVNLHVNHQIDVAFETSLVGAGTYNGSPNPGNGYASCSNTYCHSNGTSLSTGAIPGTTTTPWGSPGPLACTSCHGNPPSYVSLNPKANSHSMHQFATCSTCHFATTTTGNSITNTAKHVNGAYDVTPDPSKTFTYSSQTVTVNFTYTFDFGGGQCLSNSCHQARGVLYPVWGDNTGGVAVQVMCNKGVACFEGVCSTQITGGLPPYTFSWDFGDGTTADTGNVGSVSHIFPSGTTNYNVVALVRDANNRLGTGNIWFTPQPAANVMPVPANSWVKNGYTVTITDLSYDPDYDDCGHSGPGMVNIWWTADWNTAEKYLPLNLTDTPSNQTFSHTYTSPGTYRIIYEVFDNEYNSGTGARRPADIYVTVP